MEIKIEKSKKVRIDFFNAEGIYGEVSYLTEQLCHALNGIGIECRIYNALNGELGEFISNLSNPPNFTCSLAIKSFFDYSQFSRQIQIPHISFCIDAPIYYASLLKDSRNLLTFVDRSIFELMKGKKDHTFFLSLGGDRNLANYQPVERCFDVLLIGACFDYENVRQSWKRYSPDLEAVLLCAAERFFSKEAPSFPEVIGKALVDKEVEVNGATYLRLCQELENYIRGKDRLELLKALKNVEITIVGPHRFGPKSWSDYMGIFPKVQILDGIYSYKKTFELIRRSKIYLNSCPSLKDGAHERVFNGLLLGSLALTNETRYYKETFKEGESILFYQPGNWNNVVEKIDYYLSNEKARQDVASKGKEVVMNHHTWDHRAQEFLKFINDYVSRQNI